MNTISSCQKGDPGNGKTSEDEVQQSIPPVQDEIINIADGGEFLDDALRMIEQPLEETTMKKENE